MPTEKVRYAELRPHEFRERLKQCPVAYLPLGTLEWHGEQLPLGTDALISENAMIRLAREVGGIVMPAVHLGPDRAKPGPDGVLIGMDYYDTTTPHRRLDGSCYWVSNGFFDMLIDAILEQLKRAGFKCVLAFGHGPSNGAWMKNVAEREARFGLKLISVTGDIRDEWKTMVDHAAKNETSLMMALRPDLVDLAQLSSDRKVIPQGVGGADPRDASAEYGEECLRSSLAALARKLKEAGFGVQ